MLNHATESSLTEESSGTSFNLDEEEKTLFLDEQTTFEDMKVVIFEISFREDTENLLLGVVVKFRLSNLKATSGTKLFFCRKVAIDMKLNNFYLKKK